MFSGLPPRQRALIRTTLSGAWLLVAAGGLSAVATEPAGIPQDFFGLAVVVTSFFAAAGVIFNRYRWEWVSSWFAAASMTPYVLAAVADTFRHGPQNLSSVFLLTALAAFFVSRALMCAAHAAKLRARHADPGGNKDVE